MDISFCIAMFIVYGIPFIFLTLFAYYNEGGLTIGNFIKYTSCTFFGGFVYVFMFILLLIKLQEVLKKYEYILDIKLIK